MTAANLDLPFLLDNLEELPSASAHGTSVSVDTKDDDQKQVVKEDLNDENDNMPLGMITVSSQNAERIIITIKKSNREQQEIGRVNKIE